MVTYEKYKHDGLGFEIVQSEIVRKTKQFILDLDGKSLEREELNRLIVLSFLSAKHMFLIGKPGVGKTFLISKLKNVLENGKYFEYLLMKDTKSEEILGYSHVDENGKIIHYTERTILEANIAILDEAFKANPELLNSFLGILSQNRNFFLRGVGEIKLDLISAFLLSNEFPKGDIMKAFDDRIHFRYEVVSIKDKENVKRLLRNDYDKSDFFNVKFSYDEIIALSKEFSKVDISESVMDSFLFLKEQIIKNGIETSDRKIDDAMDIFRASAYLNGRDYITYSDLFLLMHIGWKTLKEKVKLHEIIFDSFFSKKEEIQRKIIDVKEEMSKIKSYKEVNVEPFLNDFIKVDNYDRESVLKYNGYVNFYISALDACENLKLKLEAMQDSYYFVMDIEENIEANMFIINYKNYSYTDEYLQEYYEVNMEFEHLYLELYKHLKTRGAKIHFSELKENDDED